MIEMEENPLSLDSKIEYLNGLAVKNNEPRFLISEKEQKKIKQLQEGKTEKGKRISYQSLKQKIEQIDEYLDFWKAHDYNWTMKHACKKIKAIIKEK